MSAEITKSSLDNEMSPDEDSNHETADGNLQPDLTNKIIQDDDDDDDDDDVGKVEEQEQVKKNHDDEEDDDDDEEIITNTLKKKSVRKNIEDDEEEDEDEHTTSVVVQEDDDDDEDSDDGENEDETVKKRDKQDDEKDDEESVKKSNDDEEDDEEDEEEEEEEEDVEDRSQPKNTTIYDFDIMMAKKKEESSRKRKRGNYDIINDNDDIIAEIINQMKDAVEADIEANKNKQAATRKLKLLPFVISQLRKVDLRDAFLDSDILSLITEWLAPLPDKSLPHFSIRESLLKILIEFNLYDVDRIKSSGIGKAIMYLYKHPKETKENKQRAKQLISCWSRPIFQLDSSFNAISREEREQRDLELMNRKRIITKQSDVNDIEAGPSSSMKKNEPKKPGDKGWIPRARVPAPSMRDYVIRPRSKVDGDVGKASKRPSNMLEKYIKNQQELKRANKRQRAVNMKIDRV